MRLLNKQGLRFIFIGVGSNFILYLLYLLLTIIGLGYKTAMTLIYVAGIMQTFLLQKKWTFNHQGFYRSSFIKYLAAYFIAYIINFSALLFFVDYLRYSHQLIQGAMILFIALLMFLLLKLWVFRPATL
jgi:putative flippase GtrA